MAASTELASRKKNHKATDFRTTLAKALWQPELSGNGLVCIMGTCPPPLERRPLGGPSTRGGE